MNNEIRTIKKLNINAKLSDVRKMLSNIMSENSYFLKGEIKIDDEEDFLLKEIIKENEKGKFIPIRDDSVNQLRIS